MNANNIRGFLVTALLFISMSGMAQDEWTIKLMDSDIRDFVTQVSTITGKSFVVDPRVKSDVTIISNTPMDADAVYELFLSVLRVHGFAAVPAGNVTKIVQQVLAKQSGNPLDFQAVDSEQLITRVLPVKNTLAENLVKILRPLIPQHAHVGGLTKPNVLLISDYANNINRLTEIIRKIDVAENPTIEIVDLKHAWVEDMIELLQELAPDEIGKTATSPNKVSIVASERTNSLVLRGEEEVVNNVKDLVLRLDIPANRSSTVQVMRLAHSDATELADILKNLVSSVEGSQPDNEQKVKVSIQPDAALNALVIRADPSTMLEMKEIISELDVRRLQVLIEAAIVEVTTDFSRKLGTELFVGDHASSNIPLGFTAPTGTLAQILQNIASDALPTDLAVDESPLIAGGRINETGTSFGFLIRALASNSNVNLLSTPSITTMDNKKATINVGLNVPFRTGSTLTGSEGASNPFTTIQRQDIGLNLEVVPHVHDGQLVRLEIIQEVSEIDERSVGNIGAAAADLITNTRKIDTTVLVDNQEVIILGGLTRDKESSSESKVPVLGNIPVLGNLFKSQTKSFEKQNLLVFLRPTVLSTRSDIKTHTERKYSRLYEVEIQGTDPAEEIKELFNGIRP
ncbi:MAG: type II secretion system secretin GspD [Gammaproteobacteria bacterium]|nr:type II secretion system secretin GspD [Gammaproteobacteria bacterium]